MAQNEYILIQFSDINGIYPSEYQEKVYIKGRPVREGLFKESFVTTEKHNLVYDDNYRQRLIQGIYYDKWRIQFIKTESNAMELLEFAETIILYSYGSAMQLSPVILDLTTEKVTGSDFDMVTIEFYDKRRENYSFRYPVNNVLRSDALLDRLTVDKLNRLQITNNVDTWNFYSALPSIEIETDAANVGESELNGQIITSRVTTKTQKQQQLFFNDEDLQLFKELAPLCGEQAGATISHFMSIYEGGVYYQAVERPTFEIETISGAIQLHKVILNLTIEVNNTYKYV